MFRSDLEVPFNHISHRPLPPAPPKLSGYGTYERGSENQQRSSQTYDPAFPLDPAPGNSSAYSTMSQCGAYGQTASGYYNSQTRPIRTVQDPMQNQRTNRANSGVLEQFSMLGPGTGRFSAFPGEMSPPESQMFVRTAPPLSENDAFQREPRQNAEYSALNNYSREELNLDMFRRAPPLDSLPTNNHSRNQNVTSEKDIDKYLESRRKALPNEIDMKEKDEANYRRAPPRMTIGDNRSVEYDFGSYEHLHMTSSDSFHSTLPREQIRDRTIFEYQLDSSSPDLSYSRPKREVPVSLKPDPKENMSNSGSSFAVFQRKVTHVDGEIGFAGTDLFFQMSKVNGFVRPQIGSIITAKAEKVQLMPFEWNALSVDIISLYPPQEDGPPRGCLPQLEQQEQIPLNLPGPFSTTIQTPMQAKPLKSILKNKPPPPPVISGAPSQGGTWRNRSPSPESPLILFEKIPTSRAVSPEGRKNKSPRRTGLSRNSPSSRRVTRKSPSPLRSTRKSPSPRRSARKSPSPRRTSRKSPSPRRSTRKSPSPRRSARKSPSPRRSTRKSPSPRRSAAKSPSPRRSRKYPSPTRSRRRFRSTSRSPAFSRSRSSSRRRDRRSRSRSPGVRRNRSRSTSREYKASRIKQSTQTRKSDICNTEAKTEHTISDPKKKPAPVCFTWSKSAKDPPTQPNANDSSNPQKIVIGKKIKKKEKEQARAYTVVRDPRSDAANKLQVTGKESKKQDISKEADSVRLQREKLQNVKMALQAAVKANQAANKKKQAQQTAFPNPLFVPQNQMMNAGPTPLLPTPLLVPPVAQYGYPSAFPPDLAQHAHYYSAPSYPPPIPEAYPPNYQSYPDQYQYNQQMQPPFGDFMSGPYAPPPQPMPQVSSADFLYPPGEAPREPPTPIQVLRTSLSIQPAKSEVRVQHSNNKNTRNPSNLSMVKNPFHPANAAAVNSDEPLPPGIESAEGTTSKNVSTGRADPSVPADKVLTSTAPAPAKITKNSSEQKNESTAGNDQDSDEICMIYVKSASLLFEDSEEQESDKKPLVQASGDVSLAQEDSIDDDEQDIMNPTTAEGLGCHPDKLSLARNWMICTRCAQRGHLIHMCDKVRVPRALPFEISMAKTLLKESRKKHGEETAKRKGSEADPTCLNSDVTEKANPTEKDSKTAATDSTVSEGTVKLWEEERLALKHKTENSNTTKSGDKSSGEKVTATSTTKGSVEKTSTTQQNQKQQKAATSTKSPNPPKAESKVPPKKSSEKIKDKAKINSSGSTAGSNSTSNTSHPVKHPKLSTESPVNNGSKTKILTKNTVSKPSPKVGKGAHKPDNSSTLLPNPNYKPRGSGGDNRLPPTHAGRDTIVRSVVNDQYRSPTSSKPGLQPSPSLAEPVVRISRRRSRSPNIHPSLITGDPMREVAVKQLEIQSLELRDLELKQEMKLLMAEREQMDMYNRGYVDGPRQNYGHSSRPQHDPAQDGLFCYVCLKRGHQRQQCIDNCPNWIRDKIPVPEGFVVDRNRGELEPFCLACGNCGHFTQSCHHRVPYVLYSDDEG